MRIPKFAAAVVALSAFVAACGDDDGGDRAADTDAEDVDETSEAAADLDDGVAAVVDGDEITVATVDEEVAAFAENPQFAEQLEGPNGDAARAQLRAQILSTAIVTEVVSSSAADLGQPVSDEDIAEARQQLEDQVGGADALDSALEQQGYTASLLDMELIGLAGISNVEDALAAEAGDDGAEEPAPADEEPAAPGEDALSPSQQRAQDHLSQELAAADVTVNEEFGTWNPEAGQVIPPGAAAPSAGGG